MVDVGKQFDLMVFAPNIRVGGGLVLLQELIKHTPKNIAVLYVLNEQIKQIEVDDCIFVPAGFLGRIKAEYLARQRSFDVKEIFCFHGVPTLFKTRCRQSLYVQNALLIDTISKQGFSMYTRLRLWAERKLMKSRLHQMACCYVQTKSMHKRLMQFCSNNRLKRPKIVLAPFLPNMVDGEITKLIKKDIDFIYPADALPHKNLQVLFQAWEILAKQDIRPTLALTLDDEVFTRLKKTIHFDAMKLNIINLGAMSHKDLKKVYQRSHALIFPSLLESFGLPLLEASQLGLEVLASEKDFVYDVCHPTDTFDPYSAESIAMAIARHMGFKTNCQDDLTGKEFWHAFSEREETV